MPSRVMYNVNDKRTFALQLKVSMDMGCNMHCVPANGLTCHPRASSLFCVFRGFAIVGDEGNQRATSWGACCPETVPLPRCGRLNVCTILHAAPRKQQKKNARREKKEAIF